MKETISAQTKKQLYEQFINRLLIVLLTGCAAGGCLLAALDYASNAQIPERHPAVLTVFALGSLGCLVYWLVTFFRGKGIEGLRGLALFALIVSVIASGAGGYATAVNIRNLSTYFLGEQITIKDKKATAESLIGYLEEWRHTPNYSLVYISEDVFYASVYNSKGEVVTQLTTKEDDPAEGEDSPDETIHSDESVAVCLTDGTAVVADKETVSHRKDADNISYVINALKWVVAGKAQIERASVSNALIDKNLVPPDAFPGTEYAVVIDGLTSMRSFFTELIGSEDTNSMLSGLVGAEATLIYNIFIAEDKIAVSSALSLNGESSLLWYIDGYTEVYDWTLGSYDWYSYDYTDAEKNELMLQEAMYNVTSMLNEFGADVGINWDSEATGTPNATPSSIAPSQEPEPSAPTD